MKYTFRFRRWIFWNKFIVIGHNYDTTQDKMLLFFPDGTIRELAKWSKCEVSLGSDWVQVTKKSLEQKAGQPIALAVEA